MASRLFSKLQQFHDDSGNPLAGGKLYFSLTGTAFSGTPKDTYTTEALSVANANPLTLDADGRCPTDIWVSGRYRVRLETSGGTLIAEDDPVEDSATGSGQQAQTQSWAGTAGGTANAITLTLSPVPTAYTDGMPVRFRIASDNTGAVTVNVNGLGAKSLVGRDAQALIGGELQANDTATAVFNSTNNRFQLHSPNVRDYGPPQNVQDTAYTFVASDAGKTVEHSDSTARAYTIPPNATTAFPLGTEIKVANYGTANVTLTRGAAVVLKRGPLGTDADYVMTPGETATLRKIGTNTWLVMGLSDYVLTHQVTVSSAASQDIDFPTGFRDFDIAIEDAVPVDDAVALILRVKVGGAVQSGASDYTNWGARSISTSVTTDGSNADTKISLCNGSISNVETEGGASAFVRLLNVFGTAQRKHIHYHSAHARDASADSAESNVGGGFFKGSDSALTGVQLLFGSGNISKANIRVYGRRG